MQKVEQSDSIGIVGTKIGSNLSSDFILSDFIVKSLRPLVEIVLWIGLVAVIIFAASTTGMNVLLALIVGLAAWFVGGVTFCGLILVFLEIREKLERVKKLDD